MKALGAAAGLGLLALGFTLAWQWNIAVELRRENEQLRAELSGERSEASHKNTDVAQVSRQGDEATTTEIAKLRSEITQLRSTAKELEALKMRLAQLQADGRRQDSRLGAEITPPTANPPAEVTESFPRESWAFAGYGSPESALLSAIWAMREGNPKTYLESLSPAEQARMAQLWENKPEGEVAAKHQSDVSKITSFRILDRQEVSPEQVVMSVYISGVDRLEKVAMQKVGDDWKFAGFMRDPKP